MKTRIIYEDPYVLVCYKPSGLAAQTGRIGQQDMVSELKNYLAKAGQETAAEQNRTVGEPYIGPVHRLDQPVEGLLVFGKTPAATAALSKQLTQGGLNKQYLAVIYGTPKESSGSLEDYLLKESGTNLSQVVTSQTAGAKKAKLSYQKMSETTTEQGDLFSLIRIELETGRHHQIRVQMSHAGMALVGDSKYGDAATKETSLRLGVRQVALCADRICFQHPKTGKEMEFGIEPEGVIFKNFHGFN